MLQGAEYMGLPVSIEISNPQNQAGMEGRAVRLVPTRVVCCWVWVEELVTSSFVALCGG